MTNPTTEPTSSSPSPDKDLQREFDYMLQEVQLASRLIGERQMRLDRIMSFFLPILSGLSVGGVVGALVAPNKSMAPIISVTTLLLSVIGFLALLAMLGIIAEVVSSVGDYHLRRHYFIGQISDTAAKYLMPRTGERFKILWRTGFNFFAICLLVVLALFNSVCLYLFVSANRILTLGTSVQNFSELFDFDSAGLGWSALLFTVQLIVIGAYVLISRKQIQNISRLLDELTPKSNGSEGQSGTSQ